MPAALRQGGQLLKRWSVLVFGLCGLCAEPMAASEPRYRRVGDGLEVWLPDGQMHLHVVSERILHVQLLPSRKVRSHPSLIVVGRDRPKVPWQLVDEGDSVTIATAAVKARVDLRAATVTFTDRDGVPILREGPRALVPVTVRGEATFTARQTFILRDDEALYGLGQHQDGRLNQRGKRLDLWQRNMRAVVPVLLSTRGYGILWDNNSLSQFDDDADGATLSSEVADAVDYYFLYGPELDQVIACYRELTGRAPLFGKWAYGYIQSKERYKTQEEILSVVEGHRTRRIPLDVIVLDWQYWPEGQWGQKSFDAARFPDPGGMMRTLHERLQARLMISVWPRMAPGGSDFAELKREKLLYLPDLHGNAFYDVYSDKARRLYWQQAERGLFSKGIDAWWCDATEPELRGWNWDPENFRSMMRPALGSGARYLNTYALMQARAMYEGQRQVTREKRVLNLTRSAYAGIQRYGAATWSGDVQATWDTLAVQIPAALNFCASGIPYWTSDIGAFFVKPGDKTYNPDAAFPEGVADENYREFYVRWFQLGAFSPLFRSHGTDTPREMWNFGEPGTWAYDTLLRFDTLRYRLLPYIYSLAWRVTSEGYTLMRALAFDFRQDAEVRDIDDQYLFGPALLVSPVVTPKTASRSVYLPAGVGWTDFWGGETQAGGRRIEAPAPIDRLPLFVRSGSILPLGPALQYALEPSSEPLELRVYPGADGAFTLYEDEGDSYRYEDGAYATIPLKWDDKTRTLTIGDRRGAFAGMQTERRFQVVCVRDGHGIGVERTPMPDAVVDYRGSAATARCP